jgi:hypothetical protein
MFDLLGNNDLPEVVDHLVEGVDQRLRPEVERVLQERFVHQCENIDEETSRPLRQGQVRVRVQAFRRSQALVDVDVDDEVRFHAQFR